MIGGVASTFIWVVQGGYLNLLFIELKEKGRYFSIFNAIINLRSVLGPMITVLALGYGNVQIYFGILTFFSLFSGLFALIFLKDFSPPPHE